MDTGQHLSQCRGGESLLGGSGDVLLMVKRRIPSTGVVYEAGMQGRAVAICDHPLILL